MLEGGFITTDPLLEHIWDGSLLPFTRIIQFKISTLKKIVRLCLAFSVQLETALCTVYPPPTHQARNPMGMYDFAPKNEIMIILRRGVHKYFVLQKKDLITSE